MANNNENQGRHGGEKHADTVPGYKDAGREAGAASGDLDTPKTDVDEGWLGRRGGADIDTAKREKELK